MQHLQKTELVELLKLTDLIIWDEAHMANKFFFEALDKSLKEIISENTQASQNIFGGKVAVLGGDFRQTFYVIPRGSRSDIIHAIINVSYIGYHLNILKLTKNMCFQSGATTSTKEEIRFFLEWILEIGDGTMYVSNDYFVDILIPDEFLISNFYFL